MAMTSDRNSFGKMGESVGPSSVAHSEGPGIAMFFQRQGVLMIGMIRSGELRVGSCGNQWKSVTLKPLGKRWTDSNTKLINTACDRRLQYASWSSCSCRRAVGSRLLPGDLPLKTVSGGTGCRDVIAPSGLPESSQPADGGAAWSHPQALIGGRVEGRILRVRHPS